MLRWILENASVALALAGLVTIMCRRVGSRPAVCHLLWLTVWAALIVPPVPATWVPGVGVRDHLQVGERWIGSFFLSAGEQDRSSAGDGVAVVPLVPVLVPEPTSDVPAGRHPPPAAGRVPPEATVDRLGAVLLVGWGLGFLAVLAYHLVNIARFQMRLRSGRSSTQPLRADVEAIAARLGIRVPAIRILAGLSSPVVWGLGRPTLLWPPTLEPREPAPGAPRPPGITPRIRGMICHELAHIQRRDHWVAWLEMAAMALCWWNPLFWFARGKIRHYSELACDAWVVGTFPDQRRAYAEALIDVAEECSRRVRPAGSVAIGDVDHRTLERRLSLIMTEKTSHKVPRWVAFACAVILFVVVPSQYGAGETPKVLGGDKLLSQLDPELNPRVQAALARAEARRSAHANEFESAVAAYRRVIAHEPSDARAHRDLGHALMKLGRYREAVAAFEAFQKAGGNAGESCFHVASAYAAQGDAADAYAQLERAIARGFLPVKGLEKSTSWQGLSETSEFAALKGRIAELAELKREATQARNERAWPEAIELCQQLVAAMPKDGMSYHLLGYCILASGKLEGAEAAFERQAACGYAEENAYHNIACSRARSGDSVGAMQALHKALKNGRHDFAIVEEDADLASLRDTPAFEELRERETQRHRLGKEGKRALVDEDWDTATVALEKLTQLVPEDPDAFGLLGKAYLGKGERDRARKAFGKQAQRGGEIPSYLCNLARVHASAGAVDEAFVCLESAVAAGYHKKSHWEHDPHLATLRGDPRFERLIAAIEEHEGHGTHREKESKKKERSQEHKKKRWD